MAFYNDIEYANLPDVKTYSLSLCRDHCIKAYVCMDKYLDHHYKERIPYLIKFLNLDSEDQINDLLNSISLIDFYEKLSDADLQKIAFDFPIS